MADESIKVGVDTIVRLYFSLFLRVNLLSTPVTCFEKLFIIRIFRRDEAGFEEFIHNFTVLLLVSVSVFHMHEILLGSNNSL